MDTAKGTASRYHLDCVVRALRGRPWPEIAATLGIDLVDTIDLTAGIGRWRASAAGETWEPTAHDQRPADPPPRPAPPALSAARRATCATCTAFRDQICTAAGCACAGLGRTDLLASRCPLDRWPRSAPS